MVTKDSEDSYQVAAVFYYTVHIFVFLIFYLYDNPLLHHFQQGQFLYCIIFFILVFLEFYFWNQSGKNPGIISKQILFDEEELKQIKEENSIINDQENHILIPPKRYCEYCQNYQPYRTKHCVNCQACIAKYDHHCFWIGTCVGELNVKYFFIMLFFQLITFLWCLQISLCGLNYNSDNYEKLNGLPENTYTKEYGAFVVITLILVAFVIFVGFLFVQYLYLISFNITMWESSSFSKITYLKVYPKNSLPFHNGIINNIKQTFSNNNKLIEWQLPQPDSNNIPKDTLFQNQWWSCCQLIQFFKILQFDIFLMFQDQSQSPQQNNQTQKINERLEYRLKHASY